MASVLFESAVRVTLIAAAVALVLRAMRIKSAALRHAVWAGVVVVMLLLPALVARGPKASLRVLPPEAIERVMATPSAGDPSAVAVKPPAEAASDTAPRRASWTWRTFAVSLYLLGLGTLLFRLALGTLQVRRLVRTAALDKGRWTHPVSATPVTVGWLKPTVILPSEWCRWPQRQLDAILAHEGEHIRRRDPLIQWVALLNRAVFWFHPLAWWLERHLSVLAEEACDAAVLSRGHDPGEYSQYLLNVAQSAARAGGRFPTIGMAMPGVHLPDRIRQILDGARAPRVSQMRLVCTAALCAVAGAAFAAGRLEHAERPATINVLNETDVDTVSRRSVPARTSRDSAQMAGAAQQAALVRGENNARGRRPQIVRGDSQKATSKSVDMSAQTAAEWPNLPITIENSQGAPLTIVAATAGVLKLESVDGEHADYAISPSVTIFNNTGQRITAFSLNIKNTESDFQYDAGRQAVIDPRTTFSGPLGRFIGLPGDPHRLHIKVVGIQFDDGSHWGQLGALIRSAQEPSARVDRGGPIAAPRWAVTSTSKAESVPEVTTLVPPSARTQSERGGPVAAVPPGVTEGGGTKSTPQARNLPYFMHGDSRMVRLGGGSLHDQAINRVQPSLPAGAVAGTVVVEVIVDEEGNVESARVASGQPFGVATSNDPFLIRAALQAARKWRFKPETAAGLPVKIIGELFFTFQ